MAGTKKADLVKTYCMQHPDMKDRQLAREIYHLHSQEWSTEDACYQQVRYYRQHHGKKDRKHRRGKEKYPRIPRPARGHAKRKVVLSNAGKWMIMGDLHVPYHDQKALECACRHAVDHKADHLLVNGDALDAYMVSQWCKELNRRNVDQEIAVLSEILHEIGDRIPGEKVYKIGNHEERIERYFLANAPHMVGASKWDLCDLLREHLNLPDWQFIDSKQLYRLGKLHGYHGHELPKGLTNPVSIGRGVWLRTAQSGFTSHWHRTSEHIETNGSKTKSWCCYSIGCLCDLHPKYGPINKWNHGFAECDLDGRGNWNFNSYRVYEGKVWG